MAIDENGRIYLNAASPKRELFNALKEQVERAEATEARAAALESNNDEMQDYINEIRVALHTEKDELTVDAAKRLMAERDKLMQANRIYGDLSIEAAQKIDELRNERDEARRELNALKRELSEAFNSGDGAYRP